MGHFTVYEWSWYGWTLSLWQLMEQNIFYYVYGSWSLSMLLARCYEFIFCFLCAIDSCFDMRWYFTTLSVNWTRTVSITHSNISSTNMTFCPSFVTVLTVLSPFLNSVEQLCTSAGSVRPLYCETCINRTPSGPNFLFGLDRCPD